MKKLFGILAVGALVVASQFSAMAGGNDANKVRKAGIVKSVEATVTTSATEQATKQTNQISNKLALTPAQTAEIAEINLSTINTINDLRTNVRDTNIRAFKTQVKAAYKSRDAAIKAVLSPVQKTSYTNIQRNIAAQRGGSLR